MVLKTPLWTQGAEHTADILRQFVGATLTDGVPGGGDLAVSQRGAGANMSVDVAAGRIVIDDYVCWSTATENRTIGAPPAPGQSRIDSVQAIVTDDNSGSGAWAIIVEPGTSSATPTPPTVPSTGVELARVTTTSSTTSITSTNITDRRPSSVKPPLRTALPATGQDGQVITLPGGSLAVRSGGAWIVHEPQTMWPVADARAIAGPLTITPGADSLGIGVNLPADRSMKVFATINGNHRATNSGGTTWPTVWLRLSGTGFTTINGQPSSDTSGNTFGSGEVFGTNLVATIPASPNPTLSVRYDVQAGSADFSGVTMSVLAFPA